MITTKQADDYLAANFPNFDAYDYEFDGRCHQYFNENKTEVFTIFANGPYVWKWELISHPSLPCPNCGRQSAVKPYRLTCSRGCRQALAAKILDARIPK